MSEGPFNQGRKLQGSAGDPYFDKLNKRRVSGDAHAGADTDNDRDAIHHTLGASPTQAAAGNHKHSSLEALATTLRPFGTAVTYKVQPVANATWQQMDFWSPTLTLQDIVMQDGPEDRTNFYVGKDGLYDIRFAAAFGNEIAAAGVRAVRIILNGVAWAYAYGSPIPAGADYATVPTFLFQRLTAGQWIQFQCLHTAGAGNINIRPSPYTQMSILRVSD